MFSFATYRAPAAAAPFSFATYRAPATVPPRTTYRAPAVDDAQADFNALLADEVASAAVSAFSACITEDKCTALVMQALSKAALPPSVNKEAVARLMYARKPEAEEALLESVRESMLDVLADMLD